MTAVSEISRTPFAPPVSRSPLAATQRRWQILYEQMAEGRDPCFQSDRRHACPETGCPYRVECVGAGLRAEWRR